MNGATPKPPTPAWTEAWKQSWEQFWFSPSDPQPLAVVRIVVGLAALIYLWSFSYELTRWFGSEGLLPQPTNDIITRGIDNQTVFRFSLFSLARTSTELWLIHSVAIASAVALTVGLATRISTGMTLLAVLSCVHRAPLLGSLLDPVLSMFLLYLCIAPAGSHASLDRLLGMPRWLRGAGVPGVAATISLRLMQVHLAALYAVMGVTKLYGDAWWDGEAIWLLMAQTHSRPVDLTFLRGQRFLLNLWTHSIAYTHLAFAALVWSRLTRPIILALAALTWLSLIPVTGQTLFCLFMVAAGGVYMPDALGRLLPRGENA